MTLIEAIRSGKYFKRPIHRNWVRDMGSMNCFVMKGKNAVPGGIYPHWNPDDILAADWEIDEEFKEVTVTIALEEFLSAYTQAKDGFEQWAARVGSMYTTGGHRDIVERMADILFGRIEKK